MHFHIVAFLAEYFILKFFSYQTMDTMALYLLKFVDDWHSLP